MTGGRIIVVAVMIVITLSLLGLVGRACNWMGQAAQVASEEVHPRELLRKYEWFKDAAASLDKKRADITVYSVRVKAIQDAGDATRADKEQMYVWMSEVAGVKASYNQLAAEYNAQMSKVNWRFTNIGDLPKGATEVLLREFKPYIDE